MDKFHRNARIGLGLTRERKSIIHERIENEEESNTAEGEKNRG